jgi:hypothetical protein
MPTTSKLPRQTMLGDKQAYGTFHDMLYIYISPISLSSFVYPEFFHVEHLRVTPRILDHQQCVSRLLCFHPAHAPRLPFCSFSPTTIDFNLYPFRCFHSPAALLLFLPQTDRNLTRIHLGRQIIITPHHLARINQPGIPIRIHPFTLFRRPSGFIQRALEEGSGPFVFGLWVRGRGGLRGETGFRERGSFGCRGGSDPGEVGRVTGFDDVVGDDAGALWGERRVWERCSITNAVKEAPEGSSPKKLTGPTSPSCSIIFKSFVYKG